MDPSVSTYLLMVGLQTCYTHDGDLDSGRQACAASTSPIQASTQTHAIFLIPVVTISRRCCILIFHTRDLKLTKGILPTPGKSSNLLKVMWDHTLSPVCLIPKLLGTSSQ